MPAVTDVAFLAHGRLKLTEIWETAISTKAMAITTATTAATSVVMAASATTTTARTTSATTTTARTTYTSASTNITTLSDTIVINGFETGVPGAPRLSAAIVRRDGKRNQRLSPALYR